MRTVMIAAVLLAAGVAAGQVPDVPPNKAALDAAIGEVIAQFNKDQAALRTAPRVERVGPSDEPYMLRATYLRATGQYQVLGGEAGGDAVTVRVRATEFEKRATKVNAGDLEDAFGAAAWRETPRGYLLDFHLRWTGAKWEQQGPPAEHPTLGTVGQP
jgi:hypothetical protein